jgi:hypothetical protein
MIPTELGFDSFVACAAAGLVVGTWRRRVAWIGLFGALDALATLAAGLGWGSSHVAAVVVLTAAALIVVPPMRAARPAALPLLLCLDNLMTAARPIDAVPAGLLSAAMAAAGFVACSLASRCVVRYADRMRHRTATPAVRYV